MLRNLNQNSSGQRVCGTPKSGVPGSTIPSTGDYGAGFAYADLSLPSDNTTEICGRITTWPSAGTLFAYEDTSFSFTGAPDGLYTFQYQLYANGSLVGSPSVVTLQQGTNGLLATLTSIARATADLTTNSANGAILANAIAVATASADLTAGFSGAVLQASPVVVATSTSVLSTAITMVGSAQVISTIGASLTTYGKSGGGFQLINRRHGRR